MIMNVTVRELSTTISLEDALCAIDPELDALEEMYQRSGSRKWDIPRREYLLCHGVRAVFGKNIVEAIRALAEGKWSERALRPGEPEKIRRAVEADIVALGNKNTDNGYIHTSFYWRWRRQLADALSHNQRRAKIAAIRYGLLDGLEITAGTRQSLIDELRIEAEALSTCFWVTELEYARDFGHTVAQREQRRETDREALFRSRISRPTLAQEPAGS